MEPMDTNARMEYMIAQAISTVVNLLSSPKQGQPPVTALNFVPDWEMFTRKRVFPMKSKKKILNEKNDVASKLLQFFTNVNKEEGQNGG